jgi:uncharacterized protein
MLNHNQLPNESQPPLPENQSAGPTGVPETVPAAPQRWGTWTAIGLSLVILLVFVIVQNIVALVFAIIDIFKAFSSNPGLDLMEYFPGLATSLMTNGQMISIAAILSAAAGLGFIYLFVKIRRGFSFREYLELKPIGGRTILILFAVLLGILGLSTFVGQYVPQQNNNFTIDVYKSAGWLPLLWFAIVVCAPVFEESFFRGFLFVSLKDSAIGPIGTIIFTGLLFAGLHALQYDMYGVAVVFVLGIVFGLVRYLTGSLWSTIILHAIWNMADLIIVAISLR